MKAALTITAIHRVFEGAFRPGIIGRKNVGRHSDGFVCFSAGSAEYVFDGYSFTAGSGGFFYLAKDSVYEIRVREKTEFICVDFDFGNEVSVQRSAVFPNVPPNTGNDFRKLFYLWSKQNPVGFAQSFSLLYRLYAEAIRIESKSYSSGAALFSRITDCVLEHYTDPDFSVSCIASQMNLSEVHIRRVFHNVGNTSPVRYINYLRLEKAKNMLISSNFSIREVAESAGFRDPFYFSRLFRTEIGMSPSDYREKRS